MSQVNVTTEVNIDNQPNIDNKLNINQFNVDTTNAHIVVIRHPDPNVLKKLLLVCPAGLYKLNNDGTLQFDYAGCLECGACRILGANTVLKKWQYPNGTFGIEYRYG